MKRFAQTTHMAQAMNERRNVCRQAIAAALCLAALIGLGPRAGAQDQLFPNAVTVSGGMTVGLPDGTGRTIPRVFTWSGSGSFMSTVPVNGFGWRSGMTLELYL